MILFKTLVHLQASCIVVDLVCLSGCCWPLWFYKILQDVGVRFCLWAKSKSLHNKLVSLSLTVTMETRKGKSYLQGLVSRRRVMAGEKGQTTLHSINWSRKPQHDSFLMCNVSSELSRYSSLVEMKFIFLWLSGNCWEKTPLGKPQLQCWVFCKQKSNADTWLLLDPNTWHYLTPDRSFRFSSNRLCFVRTLGSLYP